MRPNSGAIDDYLGVGVHTGLELAVGVGQVDLDAKATGLDVDGPGDAGNARRDRLVTVALDRHAGLGADVDVAGVLLGDVDEDPDDIDAIDEEQRRGTAGRGLGSLRSNHLRGVADRGLDEVEGVGITGHDQTVVSAVSAR